MSNDYKLLLAYGVFSSQLKLCKISFSFTQDIDTIMRYIAFNVIIFSNHVMIGILYAKSYS